MVLLPNPSESVSRMPDLDMNASSHQMLRSASAQNVPPASSICELGALMNRYCRAISCSRCNRTKFVQHIDLEYFHSSIYVFGYQRLGYIDEMADAVSFILLNKTKSTCVFVQTFRFQVDLCRKRNFLHQRWRTSTLVSCMELSSSTTSTRSRRILFQEADLFHRTEFIFPVVY